MLSDREKMRKYSEVDEFEDDNLSEEEEDNEEDHHFDGTKLSKNPLMAKDPWTIAEDMDLKRLVESNRNLGFAKTRTSHCVGGIWVVKRVILLLLFFPALAWPLHGIMREYHV